MEHQKKEIFLTLLYRGLRRIISVYSVGSKMVLHLFSPEQWSIEGSSEKSSAHKSSRSNIKDVIFKYHCTLSRQAFKNKKLEKYSTQDNNVLEAFFNSAGVYHKLPNNIFRQILLLCAPFLLKPQEAAL